LRTAVDVSVSGLAHREAVMSFAGRIQERNMGMTTYKTEINI